MKIICFQLMAIQISVLAVSCIDSSYIGCYENVDDFTPGYLILNNSGDTCVRHCYPKHRYVYVHTSVCSCGSELKGNKVDDTECDEACPDSLFNGTCGGQTYETMSVYTIGGGEEKNVTDNQSSYINQNTKVPLSTTENADLYIAASISVAVLFIVIFGLAVIIRRRLTRSFDIAQAIDKSFYNNRAKVTITINQEENDHIEDNGDIVGIQSPSTIQDEYSRLRMPDGFRFIDQNYSRINKKKQGACVILDDGYSHLNISEGTDKHFTKSCTCCSKNKQFSKSGKVRKGHRFGQQQRDDGYDEIGTHVSITSTEQNNAFSEQTRCNFIIPGSKCRCEKCVGANSKNKRSPRLVNVIVDRPCEVKRPNTYDEIYFDDEQVLEHGQ